MSLKSWFVRDSWEKGPRVKWWTIALVSGVCVGASSIVLPIIDESYRSGVWGNVFVEVWGLMASIFVAWAWFKHFRTERLEKATGYRLNKPVRLLLECVDSLYSAACETPTDARTALSQSTRTALLNACDELLVMISFYGQYLEFEDLRRYEDLRSEAITIARIDNSLDDIQYMWQFTTGIYRLRFDGRLILGNRPISGDWDPLWKAIHRWGNAEVDRVTRKTGDSKDCVFEN